MLHEIFKHWVLFIEHLLCGKHFYTFLYIINGLNNWSMYSNQAKYLDFKKIMIEISFFFLIWFNPLLHYGFHFVVQIMLKFNSKIYLNSKYAQQRIVTYLHMSQFFFWGEIKWWILSQVSSTVSVLCVLHFVM